MDDAASPVLACLMSPFAYLDAAPKVVAVDADRVRRIYVAGPMTGYPDFNFPAFDHAARVLRAEGWHVENPADHGIVAGARRLDYLRYDVARLASCGAIYLLKDWETSDGAMWELQLARFFEMRIVVAPGASAAAD